MSESNVLDTMAEFNAMAQADRERLVRAFETAPTAISVGALATHISTDTGVDKEFLEAIIRSIGKLAALSVDDETFKLSMVGIMAARPSDLSEPDRASVTEHLTRLLSCETSIVLTRKSQQLLWGHGNVFKDAHVITQIRPIFFHDINRPVSSALLVHELRIDYRANGVDSSLCVAMDFGDIETLRRVVVRAQTKERALRAAPAMTYLGDTQQ